MSVVFGNALRDARVNLQQTCASVSKDNRSQPSYKMLVELEKGLISSHLSMQRIAPFV